MPPDRTPRILYHASYKEMHMSYNLSGANVTRWFSTKNSTSVVGRFNSKASCHGTVADRWPVFSRKVGSSTKPLNCFFISDSTSMWFEVMMRPRPFEAGASLLLWRSKTSARSASSWQPSPTFSSGPPSLTSSSQRRNRGSTKLLTVSSTFFNFDPIPPLFSVKTSCPASHQGFFKPKLSPFRPRQHS